MVTARHQMNSICAHNLLVVRAVGSFALLVVRVLEHQVETLVFRGDGRVPLAAVVGRRCAPRRSRGNSR
mgnify:CR=1 FL=1